MQIADQCEKFSSVSRFECYEWFYEYRKNSRASLSPVQVGIASSGKK